MSMWHYTRTPSHARALLAVVVLALPGCKGRSTRTEGQTRPAGDTIPPGEQLLADPNGQESTPAFPLILADQCPGEGCALGEWRACGAVPAYEREGDTTSVAFQLARDQVFEATAANMHVVRPGIVVITDTVPNSPYDPEPTVFVPGDTAYVLGYVGEGFFNVWYRGTVVETEGFWRWDSQDRSNRKISGDLLERRITEWWAAISTGARDGWIRADADSIVVANALFPEDTVCDR